MRGRGLKRNKLCGTNDFCICPQCGYSSPHMPGNPCRNFLCPVCHTPLMRSGNDLSANKTSSNKPGTKIKSYPKVNPDLCVGCGACVKKCPRQAISIVEGIAFINENECASCGVCKSQCPVGAIS